MPAITEILRVARDAGASDVHLTVDSPPFLRLHGRLLPLDRAVREGWLSVNDTLQQPLSEDKLWQLARKMLSSDQWNRLKEYGECDLAFALESLGRFRVNVYRQSGRIALAIRLLHSRISSFRELGLPPVLEQLSRKTRGLLLVTGPTGSGKSTTLAAVIDLINSERDCHIITLEDPVEYVHHHKRSLIHQREIGQDSLSFANALRAALRQDPDVILVGEMRDVETIGIAITAAETGHLVLATLHTSSAAETIDRIVDVFPPHQQQQIRLQLSNTLQGVVAQQLIPRSDQKGRVLAVEVLVATPAVRNLIREGKTYQIFSQIQTGSRYGMQSLDNALRALYQAGLITRDELISRASDAAFVQR
ncbi:MAG: type IV pilus twitching motility protein PilT [Peptococcaceae bacterium]|nr:type IV pilus twitching motility protein PilT [Peptococcaceae bacterium]